MAALRSCVAKRFFCAPWRRGCQSTVASPPLHTKASPSGLALLCPLEQRYCCRRRKLVLRSLQVKQQLRRLARRINGDRSLLIFVLDSDNSAWPDLCSFVLDACVTALARHVALSYRDPATSDLFSCRSNLVPRSGTASLRGSKKPRKTVARRRRCWT